MKLTKKQKNMITTASSKALGTFSPIHGINVVPVSMVTTLDNSIILFNYYMEKTLENIQFNNSVSLTCWSGNKGLQFKAVAEYKTSDKVFDDFKREDELAEIPFRGILILTVIDIYDVSIPIH